MSVIIKGMDMPKRCSSCHCICGGGAYPPSWRCGLTDKPISDYNIRDKNCPLGKLPEKHGRLIDADRLIARLENEMRSGLYADTEKDEETKKFAYAIHKLLIEQIQAEETVIESEE